MGESFFEVWINELEDRPDLCSWMQDFSIQTWEKIGFIRRSKGLKMYETSITQDLVFQCYKIALDSGLVRIYESTLEKRNGNDLEIVVQTRLGYVLFAVQAKIIYPSHKYEAIDHPVKGGGQQIDLLLNYANSRWPTAIPLYLLYNACTDPTMLSTVIPMLGPEPGLYGCSLVHAEEMKANFWKERMKGKTKKWGWEIPRFDDVHPGMAVPFHELACFFLSAPVEALREHKWLHAFAKGRSRFHTYEDVIQDPFWKDLAPSRSIGRINTERALGNIKVEESQSDFRPKFRILLSADRLLRLE